MIYSIAMSHAFTGNGIILNNGSSTKATPQKQKDLSNNESFVEFKTAEGSVVHGQLSRTTRYSANFEIYNPTVILKASEALTNFVIRFQGNSVYSGRAVVYSLIDTGAKIICEVALDEAGWTKLNVYQDSQHSLKIEDEFNGFLEDWQKFYLVSPEFKIIVADMQSFLHNFQLWMNRMEIRFGDMAPNGRLELDQKTMEEVGRLFVPAFDRLHERLEAVSQKIAQDIRPIYRAFAQRHLHPLMLCSPFGHRAYSKPLGYAGDYEMVNMIALNPYQGPTLYAKMVNLWFLSQWPSKAHRNRLSYLKTILESETLRAHRNNKKMKVFNFACGPAIEIQNFLSDFALSNNACITLSDFNQETLERLKVIISELKTRHRRNSSIQFVKKSVNQLFKEAHKLSSQKSKYDLIYCAGLFDYLPDSTCAQLMDIFYSRLAPGGLLAVTNVVDDKPFRHMLEFILDWHLIYRDVTNCSSIYPDSIPADARSIKKDPTGVNIFIEARKPSE